MKIKIPRLYNVKNHSSKLCINKISILLSDGIYGDISSISIQLFDGILGNISSISALLSDGIY